VKNSEQSGLQLIFSNLPAATPESNAEDWCSAVDIGGKEDLLKTSSCQYPKD
jgi:hypothetical protein